MCRFRNRSPACDGAPSRPPPAARCRPVHPVVYRHADRIRAAFDCGKHIRGGHPQIVLPVEFEREPAARQFFQPAKTAPRPKGIPDTDGVRDTHPAGPGFPCREHEPAEQRDAGARGVLGADGHQPEPGTRTPDDSRKSAPKPALLLAEGVEQDGRHRKRYVHGIDAAIPACSRSCAVARHQAVIRHPVRRLTIARRSARSSSSMAGVPASSSGTPTAAIAAAISSFSECEKTTPGACSPSRRVLSMRWTLGWAMALRRAEALPPVCPAPRHPASGRFCPRPFFRTSGLQGRPQ